MARQARAESKSGCYHVVLRGINQQNIFEEAEDYQKFLQAVKTCKEISAFKLYSYCIMSNHVHLLIRVGEESLAQIFKRIGVRYVSWYNHKYRRTGHLFQDRYKSEPVDDDGYLLTVVRYIHQNPVKAKLCRAPEEYPWSSYRDITADGSICDCGELLILLSDDRAQALKLFKELTHEEKSDVCLDIEAGRPRFSDEEVRAMIKAQCEAQNIGEIQKLSVETRDKLIRFLKEAGVPYRQIARLTGSTYGIVRNK